ncbi:MAG: hypothetical protein DME22_23120 [Verrucomicrobia bacterium]|nr:MAG: hypothetical protein DME22_23120 [Verrucomicrobiota bacterium]PYJ94135.1 MAG: hypothetical protein DME23_25345 [Verrucomicrobiota bacterium]
MSLIKLLSVSQSLVGGRNQPERYKMADQNLLPKFAPVGRPISLAPKRKPQEPLAQNGSDKLKIRTAASGIESAPGALASDPMQGKTSPLAGSTAEVVTTIAPKTPSAVCVNAIPASTNWFRLRNNPFATRLAVKINSQPPARTELSLDAVKPVRNDLSDADLEVVSAKPETKHSGAQKPPGRPWFKPELTGLAWRRLTARLFDSERMRV